MQQDNRIFPRFGQDSLFNIGAALTAPVQGINRPKHREHIQLLFEAFVPASIGRTDKNGFRSCYLLQYLIRGNQLLSKGFPVIACQLNMTIGVVADQMSLLLHTQNQLRIFFCILPCNKKTGFCASLCQAVQKYFRIDRMRAVIKGKGDLFGLYCIGYAARSLYCCLFLSRFFPPLSVALPQQFQKAAIQPEKVPVELLPFHFVSLFYVPDVPWKTAFSGSFFLIYAAEALYHSERTTQQRQNLICLQKNYRILTVLVPGLSSEIPAAESCV